MIAGERERTEDQVRVRCCLVCIYMPAIDRSIDDCRGVTVEPKLGRWHTTSADGVFILDSRVGPVVEDSKFVSETEGKQRGNRTETEALSPTTA